jgi:hypothetical protein
MQPALVVQFDDDPVLFTPEGKVSVLDGIKALTQLEHPECLWESLKKEHPEILDPVDRPPQKSRFLQPRRSLSLSRLMRDRIASQTHEAFSRILLATSLRVWRPKLWFASP